MPQPLRWGVLGVSELVGRLAVLPALQRSPNAELVAIAARDISRAQAEAQRFGIRRAYGSYDEVIADPEVEAVYIPLPNSLHGPWSIAAMHAGKHVLCEKPLACTAAEAQSMADAAASTGMVLMEAYMSHYHPRHRKVIELAKSGALGEIQRMTATFTFMNEHPENYRWLPEMGGGALLDVGIYCLEPMLAIAGEPVAVGVERGWGLKLSPSGVDVSFAADLYFADDVFGSLVTSFEAEEMQRIDVICANGRLAVAEEAFTGGADYRLIELTHVDGRVEQIDAGGANPYYEMVEHFTAVVRGEAESQRPPAASVRTLRVLDRLRLAASAQIGK